MPTVTDITELLKDATKATPAAGPVEKLSPGGVTVPKGTVITFPPVPPVAVSAPTPDDGPGRYRVELAGCPAVWEGEAKHEHDAIKQFKQHNGIITTTRDFTVSRA